MIFKKITVCFFLSKKSDKSDKSKVQTFFFLFVLFIPFSFSLISQDFCREISDEKIIALYKKCIDKKNKIGKEQKMKFLKEIVENEPDFAEAHLLLSKEIILTCNYQGTSISPAEEHLLKVIELCPELHADPYYYLGLLNMGRQDYEKSKKYYEKFLKFPTEDSKKIPKDYEEKYEFAKGEFEYAKFYSEIFRDSVPFDPKQVKDVSSVADEYLPLITPDNEFLFFTRKTEKKSRVKTSYVESHTKEYLERFSKAKRTSENNFDTGEPMPFPFNEYDSYNYGGATISIDNKHIFLTICKPGKGNYINCDIYSSDYIFAPDSNSSAPYWHWTPMKNLGPNVNTEDGWEGQPSLSSDGATLYFASARADSKGIDIYFTERDSLNGEWKPAKNLGAPVNTEYNDKSPFIHSDSKTLYFSSQGHLGLGGFDVFYTRMLPGGKWSQPKNIGYPINSNKDEHGFIVSTDGKKVFFASDMLRKQGTGLDIFSFELYEGARPEKVVFVKGEVKNENDSIVPNAKVELKNLKTKEVKEFKVDTTDGTFAAVMTLEGAEDVMLMVKADDIAFNSKLISSKDTNAIKKINVVAEEIKIGKPYRINEIYYETNSAEIREESKIILDEFAEYLTKHPNMKIAIHGHTDDVGKDEDNLALSTDRAFSVMAYLQEKGVNKNNLSHKGFGETKPIASNSTSEGRALNRRTEFVILEK